MNKKTLFLYGFLIWILAFAMSFIIWPIHESNRPLFESIMPSTLTFLVLLFSIKIFQKIEGNYLRSGFIVGGAWFFINIFFDSLLFFEGPMKMTLFNYVSDIGMTYLIIFFIPLGFGYFLENQ
jgi:hypothetical protein